MNYYNYFTEIEDTFVRRRGKHLLLSPIDWAMIESWRERGIPLHVVVRGIETVFDNFEKNPKPRTIKGLIFCREEVEAQAAEWAEGQVGRSGSETADAIGSGDTHFSPEKLREHIEKAITVLGSFQNDRMQEEAERASARLQALLGELSEDVETIDKALQDIEHFLDEAMLARTDERLLRSIEKEVNEQLKPYKQGLDKTSYDQTFRLMLLKRLREENGVPRLGLFYL